MNYNKCMIISIFTISIIMFLSGCMESNNTIPHNTDTPVKIEVGTLSNNFTKNIYIGLYDFNNRHTTADGIAEITMFKGSINDFPNANEFVSKKLYNISKSEFNDVKFNYKREIKQTELLWEDKLPSEFKPKAGDTYRINIYFQPAGTNQKLSNSSLIVWG